MSYTSNEIAPLLLTGIPTFYNYATIVSGNTVDFFGYIDTLLSFGSRTRSLITYSISWQSAKSWCDQHNKTIINYPLNEDGNILISSTTVMLIGGWNNPGRFYYTIRWGSTWKNWSCLSSLYDIIEIPSNFTIYSYKVSGSNLDGFYMYKAASMKYTTITCFVFGRYGTLLLTFGINGSGNINSLKSTTLLMLTDSESYTVKYHSDNTITIKSSAAYDSFVVLLSRSTSKDAITMSGHTYDSASTDWDDY